jgi:hypothetical protein
MKILSNQLRALLLSAICVCRFANVLAGAILDDGDFDNLPIGVAPVIAELELGVRRQVGAWRFFDPDPAAPAYSIEPTASIDPARSGNSLQIQSSQLGSNAYNTFTTPIVRQRAARCERPPRCSAIGRPPKMLVSRILDSPTNAKCSENDSPRANPGIRSMASN